MPVVLVADKNKKLILAVMWQLMRQFTLDMLKQLQTSDDALVTEKTVVDWANTQVAKAGPTGPPVRSDTISERGEIRLQRGCFLFYYIHGSICHKKNSKIVFVI